MRGFISLVTVLFSFTAASGIAGGAVPRPGDAGDRIRAYWYNVPEDSVSFPLNGQTARFHSTLQIRGPAAGDSFRVRATAYGTGNRKVFQGEYVVEGEKAEGPSELVVRGGEFLLTVPVDPLPRNPERIMVEITGSGHRYTKDIRCRYHHLSGTITDFEGRPFRAFVTVRPDAFDFNTTVWSDSSGHYSIELPERTYSNIAVDDQSYGISTAESWAWHIILDEDQRLDFKVGTGEVYNLKAWPNNGGYKTIFVSFRPMDIAYYTAIQGRTADVNGNSFTLTDVTPELAPEDISVRLNGREVKTVSVQPYYETGPGKAMRACLLQVERPDSLRSGKQTLSVEYSKEVIIGEKRVRCAAQGQCQFPLNFYGLSEE